MDRQPPAVHIVGFFAEEVEQLGVAHGDQEVKGVIRVAHNEEQGSFPVSQSLLFSILSPLIFNHCLLFNRNIEIFLYIRLNDN